MTQRDVHLFIPGPAGADPEVLEALSAPIRPHYGPEFVAAYNLARERTKRLFRTDGDLFLFVGPGTAALDAAMASALPDGSRVLVVVNGLFSQRLGQMAKAHRAEIDVIEYAPGEPIDPDQVIGRLRAGPGYDAITLVQHETSTGVLNPIGPVTRAAREAGVLSFVDAISSAGGVELEVDAWGIDFCVAVPNKILAAEPGLASVSVSRQAWAAIDANPDTRGWYFDLRTWRRYDLEWADWHPYPTTIPTGVLDALNVALGKILEEGVQGRIERTRRSADKVRAALREMGFSMFVPDEYASPLTTAVHARADLPVAELISGLEQRHGIYISAGLGALRHKIFRIGHMGSAIEEGETDLLLAAIDEALRLGGGTLKEESAGVE